jgi:hypothetical protein
MSIRRIYLSLGIFGSLVWLMAMTRLLYDFNVLSPDSVMYALPIAVMQHPFHLGIPYLNDFMGYGEHWGHHWPGALWVKAVIFSVIPYRPWIDLLYNLLLLLFVGLLTGWIVGKTTGSKLLSLFSVVLVCSDRILVGGIGFMRIEIVGMFSFNLLLALSVIPSESRKRFPVLAVVFLGAFLSAACHPYSMVLAATFTALYGAFLLLRRRSLDKFFFVLCAGFVSGIALFMLWLLLQPECMRQFVTNLQLQRGFYQNYNSLYEGLMYNYRFGSGVVLWGAAIVAAISLLLNSGVRRTIRSNTEDEMAIIAAILFLVLCFMHTVTKCENFYYLGFGSPLVAILLSVATARLNQGRYKWIGNITQGVFFGIAILSFSLFPLRLYTYYSAGFPSIIDSKKSLLGSIPPGSTVFIPPDLWNVAYSDTAHCFKFWTFCVASSISIRHEYETKAYRDLNSRCYLVVNEAAAGSSDRFGIGPTFNISPPDNRHWVPFNRLKQMFHGKVPWGLNYVVYKYRD